MGNGSDRIRSYKDLVAWQRAFALGREVYRLTSQFPGDERFGLTAQLRRAAVSIASNIAEGYGRASRPEYLRFLRIARGSLYEVETQMLFALEFGFVAAAESEAISERINDTARVLSGLIHSLEGSE
ncbi:MAG: four helix bundle protein [Phycisphaerales bacterium]